MKYWILQHYCDLSTQNGVLTKPTQAQQRFQENKYFTRSKQLLQSWAGAISKLVSLSHTVFYYRTFSYLIFASFSCFKHSLTVRTPAQPSPKQASNIHSKWDRIYFHSHRKYLFTRVSHPPFAYYTMKPTDQYSSCNGYLSLIPLFILLD